jgi:hypothetical protein
VTLASRGQPVVLTSQSLAVSMVAGAKVRILPLPIHDRSLTVVVIQSWSVTTASLFQSPRR